MLLYLKCYEYIKTPKEWKETYQGDFQWKFSVNYIVYINRLQTSYMLHMYVACDINGI